MVVCAHLFMGLMVDNQLFRHQNNKIAGIYRVRILVNRTWINFVLYIPKRKPNIFVTPVKLSFVQNALSESTKVTQLVIIVKRNLIR